MTNKNQVIVQLQKDVNKEIDASKFDVSIALNQLYPRALEVLDAANNVEEANEIRHLLEALVTYTNRHIPTLMKDRKKQLKSANKGNDAFIQACRKAGRVWLVTGKHRGRPPKPDNEDQMKMEISEETKESVQTGTLLAPITVIEAGFTGNRDAQRCVKAAHIGDEDYRTYKKECDQNGRQYTLTGVEAVYNLLNPKIVDGEVVSFKKRPLDKFLEQEANKIGNRKDEAEGKVLQLMQTAVDSLMDAFEIVRDDLQIDQAA